VGDRRRSGQDGGVDGRRTLLPAGVGSPADLAELLDREGYLADDGLATACYLALALPRPLFCEGEAGVGKTSLAHALAGALGAPLLRLQCYEGIDASQALYDWDFPRQLMHLRAAEAAGSAGADPRALESELYDRRFLVARPLLAALETSPCVLLVDEVDRADDEFEAFLLEVLSEFAVTIPELGTVRADVPPVVVVTRNRTREVHDALKRRCLYHWLEHPPFEREVAIVRRRLPEAPDLLARQVAGAVARLRQEDLLKPPGVAETIDWTAALLALGAERLDPDTATRTLGAVLKYREDVERANRLDLGAVVAQAVGGG
jgi:MoxR-like ATPase